MNRKYLVNLIIMLFLNIHAAHSQDTLRLYLDRDFNNIEKSKAVIIRDAIVHNSRYWITDQYTDGRMIMTGEYSSVSPWVEDGPFRYYDAKGELYASGNFKNGKMSGKWIYHDKNKIDTVDYDPALLILKTSSQIHDWRLLRSTNMEVLPDLLNFIQSHLHFPPRALQIYGNSIIPIRIIIDKDRNWMPVSIGLSYVDFDLEIFRILSLAPDSILLGMSKKSGNIYYDFNVDFDPYKLLVSAESDTSSPVYIFVEQMAIFNGGDINKFRDWVQKNVIYPPEAVEKGEYGRVTIQMVVTATGLVDQARVLHSSGSKSLDNEALRVVKSSPKWVPAKNDNQPVSQQFVFPVIFMLQ